MKVFILLVHKTIRSSAFWGMSFLNRILKIKDCYVCPVCNFYGHFMAVQPETGERKHAQCPGCGSLERHRFQRLVFKAISRSLDTKKLKMLHFAPESSSRDYFKSSFIEYVTADLNRKDVDCHEDLTALSFKDDSFDLIYASHVLEHIKDDHAALSEIKRVLRSGGMAILPVPVIGEVTIEYNEPAPHETYHVRCPGLDYYERYGNFFSRVELFKSSDFDEKYQVYLYENRSSWPRTMPLRPSVLGERHEDIVPVCYK